MDFFLTLVACTTLLILIGIILLRYLAVNNHIFNFDTNNFILPGVNFKGKFHDRKLNIVIFLSILDLS